MGKQPKNIGEPGDLGKQIENPGKQPGNQVKQTEKLKQLENLEKQSENQVKEPENREEYHENQVKQQENYWKQSKDQTKNQGKDPKNHVILSENLGKPNSRVKKLENQGKTSENHNNQIENQCEQGKLTETERKQCESRWVQSKNKKKHPQKLLNGPEFQLASKWTCLICSDDFDGSSYLEEDMLTHQGQLRGKKGEDLDRKMKGFMNDLINISASKEIPRKLISGIWKSWFSNCKERFEKWETDKMLTPLNIEDFFRNTKR